MKNTNVPKFTNPEVQEVFKNYDKDVKEKLLFLRQLIFDTGKEISEVGGLKETLKWNEPSYSPTKPKIGSPIRINRLKGNGQYAMYFNCQSNLVPTFRQIYPKIFTYEGNRAIIFDLQDEVPVKELCHCISLALTYHLIKSSMNPTNSK